MNLFTSKKYYSDNGVCSFHEFARELDEDYLRTQVNGGDCGGGAPSGTGGSGGSGSGGGTGHGTGGSSSSGATTTPQAPAVNPGAGETQNSGNQSNPGYTGGGGNYEPPKEVMSNPQAYAYWLSLQDKAMKEGDPGKYKDYNVVPDYKQNIVDKNSNTIQNEQKTLIQFGAGGRVALIGGLSGYIGIVYNPNDPMDSGIRFQGGIGTGVETGIVTPASNSIKSVVKESLTKGAGELLVENVMDNCNAEKFTKPTKSTDLEGVTTNLYASALLGMSVDCDTKQITGIEFGSVGGGVYKEASTVITLREVVDGYNKVVDGIKSAVNTVSGWLGW